MDVENIFSRIFKENEIDIEEAFNVIVEINTSEEFSAVYNCRNLLSEIRMFADSKEKVNTLLEIFKENLKQINSKEEKRRLISRLLRLFIRPKKAKIVNKGEIEIDVEEDNREY
jgi:hypothetical protein